MNNLTVETEDTFASLLELAANNDVEGVKHIIENGFSGSNEVGFWYGRHKGSNQMVLLHRTPLMVASTYGSVDVVKLIVSLSNTDLNKSCGVDKTTALHCAASGGSPDAINVVKLLLDAGADPNLVDAYGNYPIDVIVVPPKLESLRSSLEELLSTNVTNAASNLGISTSTSNSSSPSLSPENGSPSSPSDSNSSPDCSKINDVSPIAYISEKKEYPTDPSFPGITNGIYLTDEFRMYSFKVRPCSRAYSHDWTECPFVHPGENARRRDPKKYHYSCVPCPDYRKGACRRGDMCEYAHGVFESWLHPAQYRTRICKDGMSCTRRVCFFAHTREELRPLYSSAGSAVPSPRSGSTNAMDFAAAMNLFPNSPSSPFTPPVSPSANGMSNMGWAQQNVPALHLSAINLQSSRLRSSLNARDIQADDVELLAEFDVQQQWLLNELSRLSQPSLSNMNLNHSKSLTPSNLDDRFSAESSAPQYSEPGLTSAGFSPSHKSAFLNQFQQYKNMLTPINTSFSPKSADHHLTQSPFARPSSARMSPQGVDPISPMGSRVSILREKQPLNFQSLSSRDLSSSSAAVGGTRGDLWSSWGSNSGQADLNADADEFGTLCRSSSFELKNNVAEEPDFGWVHSLFKESPQEMQQNDQAVGGAGSSGEGSSSNQVTDPIDETFLGAWLEQMQFDKFVA